MGQILTQVPTSLRRPGIYSEFEFDANPNSLVTIPKQVVIIAEAKGGTAPVNVPVQIFSGTDADAKLGQGTMAALGCKAAFAQAALLGTGPNIWCCPLAEASGGTQTQNTITITSSSALAGTLTIQIAGVTINAGVNAGDSATTIASTLLAQIQAAYANLPVTASSAAGVVTTTNITKGVNGNDVTFNLVSAPTGVTCVFAQSVAGAGAIDTTPSVQALSNQRYHALAFANHTSTDIAVGLTDRTSNWSYAAQNYKYYFYASAASIGTAQTLATAANDLGIMVPVCTGILNLPVAIAACAASAWFSFNAPNQNMDGAQLALVPPSGTNAYTDAQIETALTGGLTPLTPSGSFVKIERLVSTVTTFNSAPFEPTREPANTRTSAELAEQIAFALAAGVADQNMSANVLNDIRDIVIQVDRIFEGLGYVENVDSFLDQIFAVVASSPSGRVNVINPHTPVPPLHQVVNHNTMFAG